VATVADVARRAGVSVSTAARALSGHGYASEETRRQVLDAAKQLGYVTNQIARSLRTRQTRLIGLLVGDVENSFYSTIARNVESVAKDAGYHVVLCNSDDRPADEREYLNLLEGMRVDALIVTPTSENRRHLARLMDKGIVIVQMDRRVNGLAADAIVVDNEAGAENAVDYLIDAGHTRIGIVTGELDVSTAPQRLAGYERVLKRRGIPIRGELIKTGSFHREHAIEVTTGLIEARTAPTAIFAANNILAEATLMALEQRALRVPRDMSVVAFDDVPWMAMVQPPLTTVRQPVADMARTAAELALRRLREGRQGPPSTIVFGTELIERGSVAPVRKVKQVRTPASTAGLRPVRRYRSSSSVEQSLAEDRAE
jgi:LacI family transcriptional regulator, galactose operon repressor